MGAHLFRERAAITRLQGIIAVVVIVVAVGAGGVLPQHRSRVRPRPRRPFHRGERPRQPGRRLQSREHHLTHGTAVTFAVQNGDDEPRTFEIAAFNVNQTIASGATNRITFTVGPPGVYPMYLPPDAAAVNGLQGEPCSDGLRHSPRGGSSGPRGLRWDIEDSSVTLLGRRSPRSPHGKVEAPREREIGRRRRRDLFVRVSRR